MFSVRNRFFISNSLSFRSSCVFSSSSSSSSSAAFNSIRSGLQPNATHSHARYFTISASSSTAPSSLLIPYHGPTGLPSSLLLSSSSSSSSSSSLTPPAVLSELLSLPSLVVSGRVLCDLECLLSGAFTPLTGFMREHEYNSVVETGRLPMKDEQYKGCLFPIPITLDVSENTVKQLNAFSSTNPSICLSDEEGNPLAILDVDSIWQPNKLFEAQQCYHPTDLTHPYSHALLNETKEYCIGGKIRGIQMPIHYDHGDLRQTPQEVRLRHEKHSITSRTAKNSNNNQNTNTSTSSSTQPQRMPLIAFQTRNPLHRAHYELTLAALREFSSVSGRLLLHPVVGMTKPGDIDHHTRVKCYRSIMPIYDQQVPCRVDLSVLPLAMRMAGPREALWHAIIRQNYGATHFIVGRDHAGPGKSASTGKDYYHPLAAQEYARAHASELSISFLYYEQMVYVPSIQQYKNIASIKKEEKTLNVSGTQLRHLLHTGSPIPDWFSFPPVLRILQQVHRPRSSQGFCIFFTGLSGSGKSTIANGLQDRLMSIDSRAYSLLDGDKVRQLMSSELSFSAEHRHLNVKRIGWVSSLIVKAGGGVIAAPIAPYHRSREWARKEVEENGGGFIEVYISTTVSVCEKRDRKGLYAKARAGVLKGFTGIDDPYEAPTEANIEINTETMEVREAVEIIVKYLKKEGYITEETQKSTE